MHPHRNMNAKNANFHNGFQDKVEDIADGVHISSFSTSTSTATAVANGTTIATTTTCITTTTSSPKVTGEYSSSPQEIDVLCGRGGAAISHPGNRAFRAHIESKKDLYKSIDTKKHDKRNISKSIVASIRKQGGRFLQKQCPNVDSNAIWFEIGDDKAIAKTCQALRERQKTNRPARSASARCSTTVFCQKKTNARLKAKTKAKTGRRNNSSNGPPTPAKELITNSHLDRTRFETDTTIGTGAFTEPIATLNSTIGPCGSGNWEWKLFDFCDEEQARLDDQLVPHRTASSPSFSRPQQQHQYQHQHEHLPHPALEPILSSSTLCASAHL